MALDAVECVYDIIINEEKQFSIWPQNLSVPDGWQREGFFGPKSACLTHIDQVWQDMRPLSLQRRMSVFEFPLSRPKRCEFPKDPGDDSANAPLLLHEFFEAQVRERPAAVAVVFGQTSLSYRELNTRANRLAHFLRTVGVGPDVLVGIAVERSLDAAVGIIGIVKAGGAYVPLDPAYPAERLTYMMEDAKLTLVLTQQHLIAQLPQDSARFWCLDSDWVETESLPDTDLCIPVDPANLAYCIYTSGSTGRPKGVLMTHSAVITHAETIPGERREPGLDDTRDIAGSYELRAGCTGHCLNIGRSIDDQTPALAKVSRCAESLETRRTDDIG